jgi:hypothetical protein
MSTTPRPVAHENVIFVVGGANDAPGFKIVVVNGHVKVVPVPGWGPEQMRELASALKIAGAAGSIKQPEASSAIMTAAANLAISQIGHLTGGQAGQTIVVVA